MAAFIVTKVGTDGETLYLLAFTDGPKWTNRKEFAYQTAWNATAQKFRRMSNADNVEAI